jgi:hypothetical protein
VRALEEAGSTVIVRLATEPSAAARPVIGAAIVRGHVRLGALLPLVGRFFLPWPLPRDLIDR